MKKWSVLFLLSTGLVFLALSASGTPGSRIQSKDINAINALKPDLNFGKLPLYFITNKGQVNQTASFYAKASRYTLWLTKEGLMFDHVRGKGYGVRGKKEKTKEGAKRPSLPLTPYPLPLIPPLIRDVSRFVFLGANKNPEMVAVEEAELKVNYFKGKDKSQWHCDVPTSKAVLYKRLYKCIDLKIYGIEKQVEYDWIVKPGGNPGDIRFQYKNVKATRIDEKGNLVIETAFGRLTHKRPVSFQTIGPKRVTVDVIFKKIDKNTYGFDVGEYDKSRELVIDPIVLAYSSYLGGNGEEYAYGLAVDGSGYVYVTGYTASTDFPTLNQYQYQTYPGSLDAFITKIDTVQSGASSLIYSTYLGGSSYDGAYGIAVDNYGHAYVTGFTRSTDFPIQNQYQSTYLGWESDAFVTKIDTTQSGASGLLYSTYLGGEGSDKGFGIAVDSSGNAYAAGSTSSTDFPLRKQYQADQPTTDTFVTKIDTTLSGDSSLVYSTYLGGGSTETIYGIAVDGNGYVYVTGYTWSTDFPILNQYQSTHQGGDGDAFITKLDTTQSGAPGLIYSTYLGGSSDDRGTGIAVGGSGNVYVTGNTWSTDFPILNQYQTDRSRSDVFVTKIDTTQSGTSSLIYSTYLGGESTECALGIAVDGSEYVYVTGYTFSTDFPILNQYQSINQGGSADAFVTKIDTTRSGAPGLLYSTYLGGSGSEYGRGIAVGGSGETYVAGETKSTDFPTLNQYQTDQPHVDAFITKLILPFITLISPNGDESWLNGSYQDITWAAGGLSGDVKITLYKDGVFVGRIADNLDPSTGSYTWTVGLYSDGTAPVGTGYTIKIKEKGTTVCDVSETSFGIYAVIDVTSPNGSENWQSGSTQTITWETQGVFGDVKITLYKDRVFVGRIADNLNPLTGSYTWTVGQHSGGTAPTGTGYTIKIKEKDTAVSDVSDAPFTIFSLTVMSPNGGESWQTGSTQTITWDAREVTGNLRISLYKDGVSVGTITSDIDPAPGSYSWIVGQHSGGTAPAGTGYKIKIREIGTPVYDLSDGSFTLTN